MDRSDLQREFAAKNRITYEEYMMLVSTLTLDEVIVCLELLKVAKHRSGYRARMETQIRSWFTDKTFLKPLNHRQFQAMRPTWPVRYNLP